MAIPKGSIKAGKPKKAKAIQEGQIKKRNKEAKFKQTPQGKVPLVHNKKNGNANPKTDVNKQSPQQQSKKKQLDFANKSKNNGSKSQSPNQKKALKKKNKTAKKVEEENEEESGDDINEGIAMTASMVEDDDDDDDDDSEVSSQDDSTPNIFGESLADDTDEDDDDFDVESEDETPGEKKGVKMFKGIKSDKKQKTEESDDDDDEDEDDDNDDDEDEDDDDEDEEDEDFDVSANSSKMETDSDDDDDEDDDEEDDDDDDDDDDDGPGLKALIGQSLVDDDDDDEDFEGKEDEDDDDDEDLDDSDEEENNSLNSSKQSDNSSAPSSPSKQERIILSPAEKKKLDDRSIFIGNVPKDVKESRLKAEFVKYGPIESLRIRGVVPESPNMTYRTAAITKKFHPKSKTVCVFIVYESEDSVFKALEMNGKQFDGNYLRVDRVNQPKDIDPKKAVFLGNLPFDTEDNDLWNTFKKCGEIESVKTNRDRATGACRGSGYINFKHEDAATLALDLNGFKLNKREIRVTRYNQNSPKKHQNSGQKRPFKQHQNSGSKKPKMDNQSNAENNGNAMKSKKKEKKPKSPSQQLSTSDDSFQGQTASAKKKGKKGNKFEKKKKVMAGKLLSKPKKPQ